MAEFNAMPSDNPADNAQPAIIASVASTWTLAICALAARFACRRISKVGFWWDDYLMIPAFIFASITSWATMTWLISFGFGRHIFIQPPSRYQEIGKVFLKNLFIAEVCNVGTLVFAKASILIFYWRLFSRNNTVRISILVIAGIVVCWGVAVITMIVLQCQPIRGFWDKSVPAQCLVDPYRFFYGSSVPNIVTDMLLLVAPMPAIWSLQLDLHQKISLTGIFAVGIFLTIVSVTRLVFLINSNTMNLDLTWVFVDAQVWTCVELNVAVFCGCLPQLRPLLTLITTGRWHTTSSQATSKGISSKGAASTKRRAVRFSSRRASLGGGKGSAQDTELKEKPSRIFKDTRPLVGKESSSWDISVQREWSVRSSLRSDYSGNGA